MTRYLAIGLAIGALIGASIVGAIWIDNSGRNSQGTIVARACVPIDTGGGVVQCANPTTFDLAIVACFNNSGAYIGVNAEDTFHMMGQCVNDYLDMKGWR